ARRRNGGLHRLALPGRGKMLFLVPLVRLANQKHEDFKDEYGDLGTSSV
ncbi:hypothetical protein GRX66_03265, partial [Halobacterium sp. PCN9]|nr:hypothetical protein [Halobacterium bonnevillei]